MHISRSHHYAHLGNPLQKRCFAYSAFILGTLKVPSANFLIRVPKVKIL